MDHIKKNIDRILANLKDQATLVAVSKYRSIPEIQAVCDAGILDLAENKVQEFRDKVNHLPSNVRWHIIGRLQKNKVKYVVGKVHLIHSVDSYSLAEALDEQSKKVDCLTQILIQVNVSGEESKQGVTPDELEPLLEKIDQLNNIRVKGLMTMAPDTKNISLLSDIFTQTKTLYDRMKSNEDRYANVCMDILSMGMTNDYSVAVACGSNMVRIGSGIFNKEEA